MRVCITGATGFIGYKLVARLMNQGHEVVGLDLVTPGIDQAMTRFVHGDIRDPGAVREAIQGADAVFSLAAAHHDFGIDDSTYFAVNREGSRILCEELDRIGIRRVCWFSSCAVYGDARAPRNEDSVPMPNGHYGASKLAGEIVFREWVARGHGRSALVIRPTITVGPGNIANMYSLIKQIASRRFVVAGRANNLKSLSYVENLLDATLHLWQRGFEGMAIYNFVEKPDLTSRQIAEAVSDALGLGSPGPTLPLWSVLAMSLPFDAMTAVSGKDFGISSMRIRKLFVHETLFEADKLAATGFQSAISLPNGIGRMVRWWLSEGSKAAPMWRQPPKEVFRRER